MNHSFFIFFSLISFHLAAKNCGAPPEHNFKQIAQLMADSSSNSSCHEIVGTEKRVPGSTIKLNGPKAYFYVEDHFDQIESMTTENRVELIRLILKNGIEKIEVTTVSGTIYTTSEESKLFTLYKKSPLEADFLKMTDLNLQDIQKRLTQLETRQAINEWPRWSQKKKINFLKKVHEMHAKVLEIPPASFETYSFDEETVLTGNASYNRPTKTLSINAHPMSLVMTNPTKAIAAVIHEGTHHFQNLKKQDFICGKIPEESPLYKQMLLLWINSEPDGYLSAFRVGEFYKKQPIERHAFYVQDKIETFLEKTYQP